MTKMNKLFQFPWHSLLFSLYPILALAAHNISEINFRVVFRPLLISLLFAISILHILKFIFNEWHRAGFLTTIYLILFFSYGHIYNVLKEINMGNFPLGRNRFLGILWIIFAGIFTWIIFKVKKGDWWKLLTRTLNLVIAALVFLQLASLLWFGYRVNRDQIRIVSDLLPQVSADPDEKSNSFPDIYYIILDAYGRSDVLHMTYGIDTSSFLLQLKDLGFYIAECSMSNYAQTDISLASSLNMNYLSELGDTFVQGNEDHASLISLIKNSTTRYLLEEIGYETVAFSTGYQWTEWENADHYYSPQGFWKLNEFENLLVRSSAGLLVLDAGIFNIDEAAIENVRGRSLFSLEKLTSLPPNLKPKFVFAHLVIPHIPFVFGPDGEVEIIGPVYSERPYTWDEYKQGYSNQVEFINNRILEIVKTIIDNSIYPPIIIIQGDHGPGYSSNPDRMSILNAYYLPEGISLLYPGITPVNTFRVVFNDYFNGDFELLEDVSRFSRYNTPYDFEMINSNCPIQ